jgi:hypothetical protein
MDSFTTIASMSGDISKLSYINELVVGVNERAKLVLTSYTEIAITAGTDFHNNFSNSSYSIFSFKRMQDVIEEICTYYVNYDIAFDKTSEWGYEVFTLSTFKALADISSGWRRATEWNGVGNPTFSYGSPEINDIAGWWLLEDIQKSLVVLKYIMVKHSYLKNGYNVYNMFNRIGIGKGTTCSSYLLSAQIAWAVGTVTPAFDDYIESYRKIETHFDSAYNLWLDRVTSYSVGGNPSTGTMKLVSGKNYSWVNFLRFDYSSYLDSEGSFPVADEWVQWDIDITNTASGQSSSKILEFNEPTSTATAWACPITIPQEDGMKNSGSMWLINWDFSYG